MKRALLLSLSLLTAGTTLVPQSTKALTYQQIENIKTASALITFAGAVGYIFYKDITNPDRLKKSSPCSPAQIAQMAGWSLLPQSHWGAVAPKGFMGGAFAPPAQGAFNFLNIPQTPFYRI